MPHRLSSLLIVVLLCCAPAQARTLRAKIARVEVAAATLHGVTVQLDWPKDAVRGDLRLSARELVASDAGLRYRDLKWRCPLRRDARGAWQCDGVLQVGRDAPMRLAVDLGQVTTTAELSRGAARMRLRRRAATPAISDIDLLRVPVAWAETLVHRAWADARLKSGTLDGALTLETPKGRPWRVHGDLGIAGLSLDTPDASIAAENVSGKFRIDYRKSPALAALDLDGHLRGGELLAGKAYVALPASPTALRIDARQRTGTGWELPRISWRDGDALSADGRASFSADARLRVLDLQLRSATIAPLRDRYLSGWMGVAGLGDLEMSGAAEGRVQLRDGVLQAVDAQLHGIDLVDPKGRFRFEGLSGTPRFSSTDAVAGELRWTRGEVYGLKFDAATLPFDSHDGGIRLREAVNVPAFGGSMKFEGFSLRPGRTGHPMDLQFGLSLDKIDIAQVAKALGFPAFEGELTGRIPSARYAGERLEFDGGLSMRLFSGSVELSQLSMERPFGVAPTLSADVVIDDLDLEALTQTLDFGSITGRLDGRIDDLRLVDWKPEAFDAQLQTDRVRGVRQRISQRAVQNITSVGDASFITSLQGRLIGLFDDFRYSRIGISCRLVNEVCSMGGLVNSGNSFTLVQGAGIPRLTVVGYNREVDWPTLVERLAAAGKGDVKPVVQ